MEKQNPILAISNIELPVDVVKNFLDTMKSDDGIKIDSLPVDDKVRIWGERSSQLFTKGVDFLRRWENIPAEPINKLMQDVWCIVGNQIVQCAFMESMPVKTITFAAYGNKGNDPAPKGVILLPINYIAQVETNATSAFGALVFIGSQVRDLYNGKITPLDSFDTHNRASAYEAEYFLTLKNLGEKIGHPLELRCDYERELLQKYPQGLKSIDESLFYEPKTTPQER